MLDLVSKLWHTLHTSTESPAIMEIINQLLTAIQQIEANVPTLISLIASAWVVQVANMFLGYRLNLFGIIPRHVIGLPGILVSPWLHGSINHIFMNSLFFLRHGRFGIHQWHADVYHYFNQYHADFRIFSLAFCPISQPRWCQ